ncbi:conserved hypothetical protein, secreted [Paludibacter propionicigenes WB4]|uniref:Lipoprotein n=1 Tax=Paludibacter propionicigenes (strain DSM 17365 / JCM 13257 / WB4) TaxID=694427 RepID=E4T2T4_PALPW|nr:hypothetical protein [Paludibacter propionicigenes]ADQ79028.1 conserved hypothetical protein, secreted [Paludibacter propionicigenes WB4]
MKKTNLSVPFRRYLTLLVIIVTLAACATISSFDQYAYVQTTSLKVDALNTMQLATTDYTANEKTVQELQTKLQKAYEYEKNRPKNEITLKLWTILLNPEGHLLGGFIHRWEKDKKLNAIFIQEEKKIVGDAFDQIAGLESQKIKLADIKTN